MKFLVVLSALIVSTFAHEISPNIIFRRQTGSCSVTDKVCGAGCISVTYTCCPDGSGGCDPTENCQRGSNGKYGCCPKGKTCVGAGGAYTSLSTNTFIFTTPASIPSSQATATGGSFNCAFGSKSCGEVCVPYTWTCCPDNRIGCDSVAASCSRGSDGSYECCSNVLGCTATSLAAGSASEAQPAFSNPFASLFSLLLAGAALFA